MDKKENSILTSERAREIRKLRKNYPSYKKIKKDLIKKWCKHLNTPELAKIIAIINGDGHIQLKKDRALVSFYSKNLYEIEKQIKNFKNLFDIDGHIYCYERDNYNYKLFFPSKELSIFLKSAGAVSGKKTNNPLIVPEWIFKGNKDLKRAYLKGIFTTEGALIKEKKTGRWRIRIYQYKHIKLRNNGIEYMKQLKNMLNDFNIPSSPVRTSNGNKRKDNSISIGIDFSIEKKGFKNFYKYIGFDNINKQRRLVEAIKELNNGSVANINLEG